jgi:hypothetical protein
VRNSSEEVHVAHGVSTDSNVSTDCSSSEVLSALVHDSEDMVGVGETLLGMVMVDSSLVSVMGMDASMVSRDSVVVGRASVLSKEVGSRFDGVVVTTSPDGLDLEHVSIMVESGSLGSKPVNSVCVGFVSVGSGVSVSVNSSNHLFVTDAHNTVGMVESVMPDTGDVSSTFVFVKRDSGSVSLSSVALVPRSDDSTPVVEVVSPFDHDSVVGIAFVSRVDRSSVHFSHVVMSFGVQLVQVTGMGSSSVHGVLVGEVLVDHVVTVTGEFHVLSTEGSLSLSVAGPVSLG